MYNKKRLRQTTNNMYTVKCPYHSSKISPTDVIFNTSCNACNIACAKLIYIFTSNYDSITELLSKSADKYELGKYVTLLHTTDLSYEIDRNGSLYKRNNNYYTYKRLLTYFGQITDANRYLYSKFYLETNDIDNFLKYNTDEYLMATYTNTRNIIYVGNDINMLIFCFASAINKAHVLSSIYAAFTSKVNAFINEFLDDIAYEHLLEYEKEKVCNYLNILDPFKIIKISQIDQLILTEAQMQSIGKYINYIESEDQLYLLQLCQTRKYNAPEIYNAFVIVNKTKLTDVLYETNTHINTIKLPY